eukprot:g11761.t1
MDFLWKASNCLNVTSPSVSRIYSDQLRKLSAQYEALSPGDGPLLPDWVSDSFCTSCGSVLTPGVNCRVRVRHRSLASPSVKRAKSKVPGKNKAKCLNEVVTTCLVCGGINARGGTERRTHDKKRRRRGGGYGRHLAGLSGGDSETPAGKRTRVATNLRGNFIPLGGTDSARKSNTNTKTLAKNKKPSRPAPPQSSIGGSHRDGGGRTTRIKDVGGGTVIKSRRGDADREATASPAWLVQAEDGKGGNDKASGGTSHGAAGAGGDAGGGGKREPQAPLPALSLLERIRRDAKKRRREDAAAAAAAVGQNN